MTTALYTIFFAFDWPLQLWNWFVSMIFHFGIFKYSYDMSNRTKLPKDVKNQTYLEMKNSRKKKRKDEKSISILRILVILLIILWLSWQIYVPTRHLWREHRPLWDADNNYFGWRMMMTKRDWVRGHIEINHPESNRTMLTVPLVDQFFFSDTMVGIQGSQLERPQYIVFLAHHIAAEIEKKKGERPKVYAEAIVNLNSRGTQNMLKEGVDLAAIPLSDLGKVEYLAKEVPLTEEQWRQIPEPFLSFIRFVNFPLWG